MNKNAEYFLEEACLNPEFLIISGSRLYGTAKYNEKGECISDIDLRGWTIPPWEYLIHREFKEKEIAKPPEGDHKIYSLKHFLSCLLKSDTQCLELLYAGKDNIQKCSPLAQELINMKDLFLTKSFYWRITGFGNSEWRKARAVKVEIEKPPKDLDEITRWIRDTIKPDKSNMDEIVYLLTSHMPRKEVSSLSGINGKRKLEYEKHGYCTSSACHSIRLLNQCTELLTNHTITFPRPEAKLLQDIKHGRMTIDEIEPLYNEAKAKADEAFEKSTLPEKVDHGKIWAWYEDVVKQYLHNDLRFK